MHMFDVFIYVRRMILAAGGFDFEDHRVGVHEWQIMKPSEFNNVPPQPFAYKCNV